MRGNTERRKDFLYANRIVSLAAVSTEWENVKFADMGEFIVYQMSGTKQKNTADF